jgi:hypothetical protein
VIIIGFFDNLRKKKEAKRLGLDLDRYEQYLSAQSTGISVEEFKRYHAAFSSRYSLEQFLRYLHLEKKQFSPQQIRRFLTELDGKLEIADYGAFLEAEKNRFGFPPIFDLPHNTVPQNVNPGIHSVPDCAGGRCNVGTLSALFGTVQGRYDP